MSVQFTDRWQQAAGGKVSPLLSAISLFVEQLQSERPKAEP